MGETEGSTGGESGPGDPRAPLVETGVPGLDRALGGGLAPYRLYLLRGGAGAGKTTLGLQFLLAGRIAGERTLYLGLSESREEVEDIAGSHGWPLEGVELHERPIAEQLKSEARQTLFHAAEIELPEVMGGLLETLDRARPQRCVLDSLAELRLLAGDGLRYRRQILLLKEYARTRGCTVLLLDGHRGPDDVEIENLMHGVILLEHEASGYGGDRRRLRIQKLRGARFSEGYHDCRIATGGLRVFPRLAALPAGAPASREPMSSGVPALDRLLGGLDRGSSLLLVGPSGTGKSSVAARIAASAAARREPVAVYLFDESRETYLARLKALGLPLGQQAESGAATVRAVDPADTPPGELVEELRRAVEQGARVAVLDTLAGLRHAIADERRLALWLRELLAYLARHGVLTVLVDPQAPSFDSRSDAELGWLADAVLAFRRYEHAGEVRPAVSVLKRRGGAHEHAIRELLLGPPHGIDLGPPLARLRGAPAGCPAPGAWGSERAR